MPKPTKPEPARKQVVLSFDERTLAVVVEVQLTGRHATIDRTIRQALWNYAKHLGIDVPIDVLKG
jgi:hypothetical protein